MTFPIHALFTGQFMDLVKPLPKPFFIYVRYQLIFSTTCHVCIADVLSFVLDHHAFYLQHFISNGNYLYTNWINVILFMLVWEMFFFFNTVTWLAGTFLSSLPKRLSCPHTGYLRIYCLLISYIISKQGWLNTVRASCWVYSVMQIACKD